MDKRLQPKLSKFCFILSYIYPTFILHLSYKKKGTLPKNSSIQLGVNLKTNCKDFYSYLRNKRQLKTGVPTLERSDGSRTSGSAESAEVLAEAFSSVSVHEQENLPNVRKPEVRGNLLNDVDICFDKVKRELETLNCFKSYGPDNIHPKLLKSLTDDSSFVNAVVLLFRKCTDSGKLPNIWKSFCPF